MLRFRQFLVFAQRHLRTEEKIGKRSLVQHAMDDDGPLFHFEVEAVVLRPETVERFALAFDFAETVAIDAFEVLFRNLELVEQFELLESAELGNFRSADFVEDDLEHAGEAKRPAKAAKFQSAGISGSFA